MLNGMAGMLQSPNAITLKNCSLWPILVRYTDLLELRSQIQSAKHIKTGKGVQHVINTGQQSCVLLCNGINCVEIATEMHAIYFENHNYRAAPRTI